MTSQTQILKNHHHADSTTTSKQPSIDQKGTTKNPTIRSPKSSASDDNQTETPSTNTSDSPGEKPSNPIEKTLSNQPQHNQQQPTLDRISSTLEIPDAENSPSDSPVSKPVSSEIHDLCEIPDQA